MPKLSSFTRFALLFYGALMLIGAGISAYRHTLEGWIRVDTIAPDLVLGLSVGAFIVVLSRLSMRIRMLRGLATEFHKVLNTLEWPDVILCALLSGLGEEAFFRGMLQPELGLVLATLIFGGVHVGPSLRYLWWTAFALVVGLGFGLLFEWRQSLVAPMAAHVLVNLLNLRYLSRLPGQDLEPEAAAEDGHQEGDAGPT